MLWISAMSLAPLSQLSRRPMKSNETNNSCMVKGMQDFKHLDHVPSWHGDWTHRQIIIAMPSLIFHFSSWDKRFTYFPVLTNIYILTYIKVVHKCAIALPELKGLAFYTFYTLTLLQMGVLRQYVVFMLPGNLTFLQLHDFFWSFFWSFLKEHSFTAALHNQLFNSFLANFDTFLSETIYGKLKAALDLTAVSPFSHLEWPNAPFW